MTKEIIDQINEEVRGNIQSGRTYFDKGQNSFGQVLTEGSRSFFGKTGWYWEDGRWYATHDPKYGGQPSVVDILRSLRR